MRAGGVAARTGRATAGDDAMTAPLLDRWLLQVRLNHVAAEHRAWEAA